MRSPIKRGYSKQKYIKTWMNIKNSFVLITKIMGNNILTHGDAYVCQWSRSSSAQKWLIAWLAPISIKTSKPRQNDRYFPDDIINCILFNENVQIFY